MRACLGNTGQNKPVLELQQVSDRMRPSHGFPKVLWGMCEVLRVEVRLLGLSPGLHTGVFAPCLEIQRTQRPREEMAPLLFPAAVLEAFLSLPALLGFSIGAELLAGRDLPLHSLSGAFPSVGLIPGVFTGILTQNATSVGKRLRKHKHTRETNWERKKINS